MSFCELSIVLIVAACVLAVGGAEAGVLWQIRDMTFCRGDIQDHVKYTGDFRTIIDVPGDGKVHELAHGMRFVDLTTDEFEIQLGQVSPSIKWEVGVRSLSDKGHFVSLIKGQGGGTHAAPLSKTGLPRWAPNDVVLKVQSDEPGTMEVLRWAVLTPKPIRFAKQHEEAAKQLAGYSPLERGIVPHWNPIIGGFVCAYNYTHPENFNYWLEDEGEQLWSFGNYPKMMEIYGKGLRDFIVNHCKHGGPVRRQNDQPLSANPFLTGGEFQFDTGLLDVSGKLAEDPHVDMHHSVYEAHGLLARLAGYFVTYKAADGSTKRICLDKPSTYKVEYDVPERDNVQMTIVGGDSSAEVVFTINVFRARVTVSAKVKAKTQISDVTAGFVLRDCKHYYKHPLNTVKRYGDVTIIHSEQPNLEDCNLVRIAGPVARNTDAHEKDGKVAEAIFSAPVAVGSDTPVKLAHVTAGSQCLVTKIDNYKDVDFADADISQSYVATYALLGLATYSYRYPQDTEARQSVDMMIQNYYDARDRARNRELGYLLWVLHLLGRDKEAEVLADLIEKRAEGRKFNSLDGSAISMGLRSVGRWALADKIGNELDPFWTEGVAPPTDLVGLACMQSPATLERSYLQLTNSLWMMYWDFPTGITTHNFRIVEEGPQETNCYLLVALDIIYRLYGGIAPIRLDFFAQTHITGMSFDAKTGEWRLKMTKASEVDIFTHFRAPKTVLWNGQPLDQAKYRYGADTGVVFVKGLTGDGELTLTVEGEMPKDKSGWEPIDYVGLKKKP